MKIFVVLALCAFAAADDAAGRHVDRFGGLEGHEVIPPPPGFEGIKGFAGITRVAESRLVGEVPTPGAIAAFPRVKHHIDAPIYSSPPLSIVDHERVNLVPTSNYYNHHGNEYVIVPPSRTQALSSPLRNYLVGTPSAGQYVYSPAPVHSEVIPSSGYQYLYSPAAVHSGVGPSTGFQYVYGNPSVHSGSQYLYSPSVPVHTGTPYVYSPSVPLTGEQYVYSPSVPVHTGEQYLYSPSVPLTGEQYVYSPSNVNYYVPEVEHKEIPLRRAPTPNHPRNGASVYYAKWQ